MTIEIWTAFAAASAVLLVIPGPTVLLVVSYALGQGWRAALPMAVGVALGDATALMASLLGLGAILATSATLFSVVKWCGAAYLVWLGIKLWRAGGSLDATPRTGGASAMRLLGHAWLVTAFNPKGIVFFVAFLPQFVDPAAPVGSQLAAFGATFVVLAFANVLAYALVAARARRFLRSPGAVRTVNRAGGTLLIGAGVATASLKGAGS